MSLWCSWHPVLPQGPELGSAGTWESSSSSTRLATCWICSKSREQEIWKPLWLCSLRLQFVMKQPGRHVLTVSNWSSPSPWWCSSPPSASTHFLSYALKRWIKGEWRRVKRIHQDFSPSLCSFLLSPVITLHNSHFNTGLPALTRCRNLLHVMKTYIPGRLPERRSH